MYLVAMVTQSNVFGGVAASILMGAVYFGLPTLCAGAYANSDLNREVMAGVWRLTGKRSFLPMLEISHGDSFSNPEKHVEIQYPMKEFTVFPQKKKVVAELPPGMADQEEQILLMLKEDGSFTQYGVMDAYTEEDAEEEEEEETEETEPTIGREQKLSNRALRELSARGIILQEGNAGNDKSSDSSEEEVSIMGVGIMKGTWDFLDGKLILAADRPSGSDVRSVHDTILEGEVVFTAEASLDENPTLGTTSAKIDSTDSTSIKNEQTKNIEGDSARTTKMGSNLEDVHLSVPEGSVKIGKFFYPKNHPSFFEQPIFKPTATGSFQLRQVLGSLNANAHKEEENIELFRNEDFYGRRFFLTSHPLKHVPKGTMRFSLRQGKMIGTNQDQPRKKSKEEIEAEKNALVPIRVVLRFGFGRSVSGSVYSEGSGLTNNDAKTYWGWIKDVSAEEAKAKKETHDDDMALSETLVTSEEDSPVVGVRKIEIHGSVLDGWGLEPEPEARFVMKERTDDDDEEDEEDDDDDDDYTRILNWKDDGDDQGPGTNDLFSSPDSFQ
eukprot:scaffold44896_cov53-Attheya_sp.AAC.2